MDLSALMTLATMSFPCLRLLVHLLVNLRFFYETSPWCLGDKYWHAIGILVLDMYFESHLSLAE